MEVIGLKDDEVKEGKKLKVSFLGFFCFILCLLSLNTSCTGACPVSRFCALSVATLLRLFAQLSILSSSYPPLSLPSFPPPRLPLFTSCTDAHRQPHISPCLLGLSISFDSSFKPPLQNLLEVQP